MNSTLKTILMAMLIIIVGSVINVFIKNITSKSTPTASVNEIIEQEIAKIKSQSPIKVDDTTSLVDAKFDAAKDKVIYSYVVDPNEPLFNSKEELYFAKSMIANSFCKYIEDKIPKNYSFEMLYFNKHKQKIMNIYIDNIICREVDKLDLPNADLKDTTGSQYFNIDEIKDVFKSLEDIRR